VKSDILVVGGGPAGLAAAIAARQRGFTVTVADAGHLPINKTCGEGIMPNGVEVLRRLGISIGSNESFPFRGIQFIDGKLAARADFGPTHGLGVRRTVLHRLMVQRALELGVTVRWGTPVTALGGDGARLGGRAFHCRWIIGADGQNSRLRRRTGQHAVWSSNPRVGIRGHFKVKPWTDCVEIYWHKHCQAYVTPVAPDLLCVALIRSKLSPALHMTELRSFFPQLAERLGDARPIDSIKGGLSVSTTLRSVVGGRLALVGDASGTIDVITGEGLSMAFQQALALGDALAQDNLMLYEAAHRRIARIPRMMARLILALDGRATLRHAAMRALAARPRIFSRLLAVHVGTLSPAAVMLDVAGLAWCMLLAGTFAGVNPL